MKSIKMIMGTAAVMAILTIGAMSVSAQEATPQKADRVETQKAAQSITIDTKTESDAYSVMAAGDGTPIKADNAETAKAAESITIDPNTESDAYSVIAAGSTAVDEDVCCITDDEAVNTDGKVQVTVNIKEDKENNKFLISWDNGETWYEMDMPMVADAQK